MILVRNVFKLKFGKTREALSVFKEMQAHAKKMGSGMAPSRLLTDIVSSFYTLVLEHTFKSLADFEASSQGMMSDPEWKAYYQKGLPLVESGYREIFTIVE
jgi:hypothetical protein